MRYCQVSDPVHGVERVVPPSCGHGNRKERLLNEADESPRCVRCRRGGCWYSTLSGSCCVDLPWCHSVLLTPVLQRRCCTSRCKGCFGLPESRLNCAHPCVTRGRRASIAVRQTSSDWGGRPNTCRVRFSGSYSTWLYGHSTVLPDGKAKPIDCQNISLDC